MRVRGCFVACDELDGAKLFARVSYRPLAAHHAGAGRGPAKPRKTRRLN